MTDSTHGIREQRTTPAGPFSRGDECQGAEAITTDGKHWDICVRDTGLVEDIQTASKYRPATSAMAAGRPGDLDAGIYAGDPEHWRPPSRLLQLESGRLHDYPVIFHTGRWFGFSTVVIHLPHQEFTRIIGSKQENFPVAAHTASIAEICANRFESVTGSP
jgi:hypothetical protein